MTDRFKYIAPDEYEQAIGWRDREIERLRKWIANLCEERAMGKPVVAVEIPMQLQHETTDQFLRRLQSTFPGVFGEIDRLKYAMRYCLTSLEQTSGEVPPTVLKDCAQVLREALSPPER